MTTLRLLLVDDHAVVRQGLSRLLSLESDFEICCEADCADDACQAAARTAPHVTLLDLNLGASSGMEALRRMKQRDPLMRILVFTMYDGPSHVTQALRAGAQGYITKNTAPEELPGAIRKLMRGERVLSSDVAQVLAREHLESESLVTRLTPREFEILRLTVRGDAVASVAEHLHISLKTVFNHQSVIRHKLGVSSDFQLMQLAVRHGLVDLQLPSPPDLNPQIMA